MGYSIWKAKDDSMGEGGDSIADLMVHITTWATTGRLTPLVTPRVTPLRTTFGDGIRDCMGDRSWTSSSVTSWVTP